MTTSHAPAPTALGEDIAAVATALYAIGTSQLAHIETDALTRAQTVLHRLAPALEAEVLRRSTPVRPNQPCPEGFHWIGQTWEHCEKCGLTAGAHAGMATPRLSDSPFSEGGWTLRPWQPGDRWYRGTVSAGDLEHVAVATEGGSGRG